VSQRLVIWLYLTVTALSAAGGLVVEIVAGRMIAPYLGMSLYTWTAIIAVVLAGFSLGHWVGGLIAGYETGRARRMTAWTLVGAALSAALSLVLIRVLSEPVIALGFAPVPTILILTTLLFFMPSFFVGIPSPVLAKLAIDEKPGETGRILGAFYATGALGSIIGTLAAGYVFISWIGSIRTILLVSVVYLVLALILFAIGAARRSEDAAARSPVFPSLVALVLGGVIAAAGWRAEAFTDVCAVESNYFCMRSVDISGDVGEPARIMVLDHLGHGINMRDHPQALLSPYVEAQDTLARIHSGAQSPYRAFFMGGGAYTLPRAWLAVRQDIEITVAEIDPAVTRYAISDFWFERDDRVEVIHADARRKLAEIEASYDVIVADAFHDITVPQHLVTDEFFRLVKSRLNQDGIFLLNIIDHHEAPRLALSLTETLKPIFPVVELWDSREQGERTTFVIAALPKPTPIAQFPSRVQPILGRDLSWERVDEARYDALVRAARPMVLTDDFAPVDRLIGVH
jgi:spermidine synthase/MFS family permease